MGRNQSVNPWGSGVTREPVLCPAFDTKPAALPGGPGDSCLFYCTANPYNKLYVKELEWASVSYNLESPFTTTRARLCARLSTEGADTRVLPLRIPKPDTTPPTKNRCTSQTQTDEVGEGQGVSQVCISAKSFENRSEN